MNTTSLLALISELYAQVNTLLEENRNLQSQLMEAQAPKPRRRKTSE